ncbi:MAG: tetratricopeptide repeat protein [Gemmatimonadota bacterium]|nr:tetratricopeptide repeat protein [Gemmatimonadota bacterium]
MAAEVASSIPTQPTSLPSDCSVADASRFTSEVHGIDSARALLTRERGLAAELRGDVREAKALLETSVRLDPGDAAVAYHLGRVSEQLRDREGALQAYCHSLAIEPASSTALDATSRIHSLTSVRPASAPVVRQARRATPRVTAVTRVVQHSAPAAIAAPVTVAVAPVRTTDNGTLAQTPTIPVDPPAPIILPGPVSQPADARPSVRTPEPSTRRTVESSTTARDVAVGAGAGAIIGAVMGRNTKSAVIGGVAGGVLGAIFSKRPSP